MECSQIPKYVMSTLCRLCAEKSSKLTPIFDDESLPLKISKCLPIQVNTTDLLPLKVCESCSSKINKTYDLYIQVEEADKQLKRLWKVLIKETMRDSVKIAECSDNAAVETQIEIPQDISVVHDEPEINASNLVINVPPETTYHSVEILGDNHLINAMSNKVMVISKAVSFEVISESIILKSSEKSNSQLCKYDTQDQKIFEVEKKMPDEKPKEINDIYQCQFPPSQFSSVESHNTTEETVKERPYLCDTCGKFFKNAKCLNSHAKTHSSVRKKHICKICSRGFLTNFFLNEHMNSHTGATPYKCPVCDKEFRERVHLRQHKSTHSTQKFVCPICGSKFNRKGNMTEHVKHYHKNGSAFEKKSEENTKETRDLKCPACSCSFPNHVLLKTHLKIHPEQKRFSCSVCGKKFRHAGSLTYHRRAAHSGERPFQCSFCDKKFSLRSVQIIHERKAHTFEQPYKCSFCCRSFTNSSSLRNHTYVHAKDKMFRCDDCGKKFSRNFNLIIHKKLHNGDRKFICEQCGKSYIQRHDLLKHQKTHKPKVEPFFCKYCGNSFSHKRDSAKHAMCQFDYFRKKQKKTETLSAEKILDSVTNTLERKNFSVEEERRILESVEKFSGERALKEDFI